MNETKIEILQILSLLLAAILNTGGHFEFLVLL